MCVASFLASFLTSFTVAGLCGEIIRLHPFLLTVQVDSKERKTYFGLKSDRFGSRLHHM